MISTVLVGGWFTENLISTVLSDVWFTVDLISIVLVDVWCTLDLISISWVDGLFNRLGRWLIHNRLISTGSIFLTVDEQIYEWQKHYECPDETAEQVEAEN